MVETFAQIISTADDVMGEEEKEWRLDVVNRRLKDQGYNSPARYVDKIASGSPASYQGSSFQFDIKGVSLPPKIPQMPMILGRNPKWDGNVRVITPRNKKLELAVDCRLSSRTSSSGHFGALGPSGVCGPPTFDGRTRGFGSE